MFIARTEYNVAGREIRIVCERGLEHLERWVLHG